ncbi:MAG TPA: hypothetical protein DHW42_02595 [Candidatus Marinimicrobia bacterium]|nr:hypothetical protein [Candidatus Neomarinimicrobiota bacterium]
MKSNKLLVSTLTLYLIIILVPTLMIAQDKQPKKVIYDTDMCLDVDDVGALALLHALENKGESELLAVIFNEVHPSGAPAIDAINTWYGRGDIPVGIYKDSFSKPDKSPYLDAVAKFPHDIEAGDTPSALDVYRKALSDQPDGSVTIISVGFLNNLDDLLIAEPKLVAKKVKELVVMAGLNNDGFNLTRHNLVEVSQSVIENWPTPLVISHNGGSIHTGAILKDAPKANPVREGFYKFFDNSFKGRSSWDELAVLYGVRGVWTVFEEITEGTGSLPNGFVWKMKPGYRSHLEHKISDAAFVEIIDDLMMMPPAKVKGTVAKKVIYDTDMCADVDDVGALAMLHAMANNNEVDILAVCFNEVHPYGAPAIDAINTWYGRGDIPVGIFKGVLENPHDSRYLESVAQFPHDLDSATAQSTLEVYQEVLRDQPDGSVTIISVGFVNNLAELLRTDPELVKAKVKELVLMAGTTDGGGFNMNQHNLSSVSEYVIREWPTPIVFTDPGGTIYTGPGLKDTPVDNPVREAYYKYFHNDFKNRPSWDQITVLYGVRGLADYFSMGTTGTGHLQNGFVYQIKSGHRTFVKPLLTDEAYAKIIQDLMLVPPLE